VTDEDDPKPPRRDPLLDHVIVWPEADGRPSGVIGSRNRSRIGLGS
jgi:hypothetical protein